MATVSLKQDPAVLAARLTRAARTAAASDLDALLITPGSDLQYLLGAGGESHERLTCLVLPAQGTPALVVPKLEAPGYDDLPLAELGIEVVTWVDGQDSHGLVVDRLGAPSRVALADAMPALHTLPLRAKLPGAEQVLASPVLRIRKYRSACTARPLVLQAPAGPKRFSAATRGLKGWTTPSVCPSGSLPGERAARGTTKG